MSSATLDRFYQEVVSDPALQQRFQSVTDRETIVNTAVQLGQEKGYNFTYSEVEDWINIQTNNPSSGELKDEELETVAGGGDKPRDDSK
ncbi:MAG TPA: Nif11-like leader peptide family natural product precursor [Cyanobacteria bacterium UBA11372]|nr:Nif11-like leader peptide family natural product precursor [Cyanobacteria bacterium UBA11372]HBE36916.1 Nif11-like leader peptide family natural product precursor [Cyanobacteria bacterium UBA11368]HBE51758.1 Nif11-like leader peptide family natural product precursor [Cyanobacteria bacterium UBA11369]